MSNKIIEVINLSKKYELHNAEVEGKKTTIDLWALKDVSFNVYEGDSLGIIGPNGSGKSTLLKLLSGITKPSFGEIIIRGKVGSILDIGAGFNQELSGKENIFLNGQLLGFSKKEIKTKYDDIVAFSEIGNFIHEPVKYYSNGMYLRLAFSIIAHLNFDVLLFDEVLSVGDNAFRSKIASFLSTKKTMILVSHNQNEIVNNTNRLITLKAGKIDSTEDFSYFNESADYANNKLLFDGGMININKEEDFNYLYFSFKTEFELPHQYRKSWAIHLKDNLENTITACIGHKDKETRYLNEFISEQSFIFNKKLFRHGNYSFAFYLANNGEYINIKPKKKYYFKLDFNQQIENDECVLCGPIFYPNTIN